MFEANYFGLSILDFIVIIGYFIAIIAIGYTTTKRVKNQEDYFLAGRRMGKFILTFGTFGQGTSPETAVTTTTMVNTNGAAGLSAQMVWGVLTIPVYWMIYGWYRRLRVLTMADFFRLRYGSKTMAGFYATVQMVYFMLVAAFAFVCLSKTVSAIVIRPVEKFTVEQRVEYDKAIELKQLERADYVSLTETQQQQLRQLRLENPRMQFSYINETLITAICGLLVLIYALGGGLEAAFLTDVLQGLFTITLAVILVPFAMIKVNKMSGTSGFLGPFKAMHQILPESFFELWGSPAVIEFTWYWILAFAFVVLIGAGAMADNVVFGAAKDEFTARYSAVVGVFVKRYCTVIWGLVAMFTIVLYRGIVTNPDYVWGHASRDLLGPVSIGLVGLMIACLMAALMAVVDAKMVKASGLFTISLYTPLFPNRSEKHYIWVGRTVGVIYVVLSVMVATQFKSVFALAKYQYAFNSIVAASFWLGMLWRRSNRPGAWMSMGLTCSTMLILPLLIPLIPGVRTNEYLVRTTNPVPTTRIYTARTMDLDERQSEIKKFDELSATAQAKTQRPQQLIAGQKFERTYILPKKGIFWMEGIELKDGQKRGAGMLNVELVIIDKVLGFDLSKNSYAMNETILMLIRIITPFIILVGVSLMTKKQDPEDVRHFYSRMMTKVIIDKEEDARAVELTYQNPHRLDHTKVWPNSNWEFKRWDRTDVKGLILALIGCSGIVGLLFLIVNLGK